MGGFATDSPSSFGTAYVDCSYPEPSSIAYQVNCQSIQPYSMITHYFEPEIFKKYFDFATAVG